MPGSLAELYGALLKQEPQGILGAARFNPLMMAKALRQQQANPRPSLASLMNYPQTWQQFGDNIQAHYPTDSPAAVRQAAFEAAKNAGPLMTVYHGSPHKFDAFDSSKIGTGEGAQAYGHGLYFAENPNVASGYKETLTARKNYDPSWWADKKLPDFISLDEQRSLLNLQEKLHKTTRGGPNLTADETALFRDLKGKYDAYHAAVDAARPTGALYKVDLPDDQIAKMLDWDKPLSQQSPTVLDALSKATGVPVEKYLSDKRTGAQIWKTWISRRGTPEEASAALNELGIPGIRYLDGGSRGAGTGTSNFVVFPGNEGALKILARE